VKCEIFTPKPHEKPTVPKYESTFNSCLLLGLYPILSRICFPIFNSPPKSMCLNNLLLKLISLKNELDGLSKIKLKFLLKSPVNGKIKDFSNLSINQWVSNLDILGGVVKYGSGNVVGYLKEEEIERFKINEDAVFIPFNGDHPKIKLISKNLDRSAISILPYLSLSSQYDGPIATRKFVSKEYENRPVKAHYQATFNIVNRNNLIEWEIPGYVHIEGYRYSPIINFFKKFFSILVRESRI